VTAAIGQGWRAERRATPWLSHAFAAAGGALVTLGVVIVGADAAGDDGSGTLGVVLCLVVILAGYAALSLLPAGFGAGAVAAIVTAVPGAIGFLLLPDSDGPDVLRGFLVLSVLGWAVCFVAPRTRGRVVFASLALLFVWAWMIGEVTGFGEDIEPVYFGPSLELTGTEFDGTDPFATPEDFSDSDDDSLEIGLVSALFGVGYLLALRALDGRGLAGLATAFVVPGLTAIASAVGALGDASGELVAGGVLGLLAGVFAAWCAALTRRRFTTWVGAALGGVGALLVAGDLTDPGADGSDDGFTAFGVLTVATGLALVAMSWPMRRLSAEPDRGDDGDDDGSPGASTPDDPDAPDTGVAPI
jgi:hypothetical protein